MVLERTAKLSYVKLILQNLGDGNFIQTQGAARSVLKCVSWVDVFFFCFFFLGFP